MATKTKKGHLRTPACQIPGMKLMPVTALRKNPKNVRTHSKKQVGQIVRSIEEFSFTSPIVADENGMVLAGHGRLDAALRLGLKEVSVISLAGLSEAKKRAFMLADNKIAANGGYDRQRLVTEIAELSELLPIEGLDLALTGYEPVEIDQLASDFEEDSSDPADQTDSAWEKAAPVSRRGDLWLLGEHRLLCGDARSEEDLDRLMNDTRAAMAFLDSPYNLKIRSLVGRGRIKHEEFAEASGEQTSKEFIHFLTDTLGNAARVSLASAVHFACIDWRHLYELSLAGRLVYGAHLNVVVWVKSNAGQGSFYRSRHELIFVYRVGYEPHLNNIELGKHGRSRSNVWEYPGVNTFRRGRMDDLRAHPTVKPVALVADAMKDCSRRGDIVLDIFCGSGTTILAAERVGRIGYGLEIEPRYVDAAIRRWQDFTKKDAVHAATGRTFGEIEQERRNNAQTEQSATRKNNRLRKGNERKVRS